MEPTDSLQTKRSAGRAMGTNERVEPTDSLQSEISAGRVDGLSVIKICCLSPPCGVDVGVRLYHGVFGVALLPLWCG